MSDRDFHDLETKIEGLYIQAMEKGLSGPQAREWVQKQIKAGKAKPSDNKMFHNREMDAEDAAIEKMMKQRGRNAAEAGRGQSARDVKESTADIGWFVVSPGGNALAGPYETEAKGKHAAQMGSVPGDIKVAVKFGEVDGWRFKALDPKQHGRNAAEAGRGQSAHDVKEAVYRVGGEARKRGAPEPWERARAFDKVNPKTGARPDRSVLKNYNPSKGKYSAIEFSDEEDFIMVLVMGDGKEFSYGDGKDPWTAYHGVNVLFFPDGKIDAEFGDPTSKAQWHKDKDKIIKVAKDSLKDKDLPGIYDGLGGKSNKRGTGKLSFDPNAATNEGKLTFKQFIMQEAKSKKIKEPGWYVVDHMDKPVDGPMQERGAHEMADELNAEHAEKHGKGDIEPYSVEYYSDYEIKRMNEGASPKFKVGDEVTVPASSGDGYGEKGVITQMMGDRAKVKFDKYTKDVQVRHLRACVEEESDKDRLAKQNVEKIMKAKADLAKARKAMQADPECSKCKTAFETAKKKLAALTQ